MAKSRTKLIINPNADMGNAWRQAADLRPVIQEFGGADWTGTVYPTHATELAHEAALQGYERVIAVGGDGTVHEVVNGLMKVPDSARPALGVVPLGSGNDFAHSIGVKGPPPAAAHQVMTGATKRIDLGLIEDGKGRREYWDNTLGIGFDAMVTIRSHSLPILRGFLMYIVAVLQTILLDHNAPMLTFNSDVEAWKARKLMLVICNGPREGGGFFVAPDARNDDGVFHYASIDHVSRPMMLRIVPEVMRGTHGRFPSVKMGQFQTLELESDKPLYIHTDGEVYSAFGTDVRKLRIQILPQALEVIA